MQFFTKLHLLTLYMVVQNTVKVKW